MATQVASESGKNVKVVVLGRSAASGRYVLAPKATAKKSKVTDKQIKAAVKSVLAKKK
jgi:hypothetical protein